MYVKIDTQPLTSMPLFLYVQAQSDSKTRKHKGHKDMAIKRWALLKLLKTYAEYQTHLRCQRINTTLAVSRIKGSDIPDL